MDSNRQTKRCRNHDYCSPCIYMITLLQTECLPPFVRISQNPRYTKVQPIVTVTPLGRILYDCLDRFFPNLHTPDGKIKILTRRVMPDHVHLLLYVKVKLDQHLGFTIARMTRHCSDALQTAYCHGLGTRAEDACYWSDFRSRIPLNHPYSMFRPGFNDRICFHKGAKDNYYNYINDNPRRYLVKKLHPDYFVNKLDLLLDERRLALYGNFFVLDNPDKAVVKISLRKELTPDLDRKIEEWEETIRCGGVLVSPFINPEERKYMQAAIDGNAGVILLVNYAFPERFKPHRQLFELSCEGRLLMVSTCRHEDRNIAMTRAEALELNAIAQQIAALMPRKACLKARH